MTTLQDLRLVDRIDGCALSRGAAALLALIVRRSRNGWLEAAGETLAAWLKASRRSVVRWSKELVDRGLIRVHRRVGAVSGLLRAAPSRYAVVRQALVDEAACDLPARALRLAKIMAERVAGHARRAAICAKLAANRNQEEEKKERCSEGAEFLDVCVGDRLPDGRKCVGFVRKGLFSVPEWA